MPNGSFFKSGIPSRASEAKGRAWAKRAAWQLIRRIVLERDDYRCRACRSKDHVDVHHLKFRSLGGSSDDPKGLIALCRCCHADVHAYRLAVEQSTTRGANGVLTFVRTDG